MTCTGACPAGRSTQSRAMPKGPVLTTVTNRRGDFHFTGLQAGWSTVWEETQPGWAPVTVATFDVPLPPGPSSVEVGLKNRQSFPVTPTNPTIRRQPPL